MYFYISHIIISDHAKQEFILKMMKIHPRLVTINVT